MDETIKRVIPNHFSLPRRINRLGQLAYNLWWTWNPEAQMLYRLISQRLWDQVNHNPVTFLKKVERSQLNAVTNDRHYLDLYDRTFQKFDTYMQDTQTWFARTYPQHTHEVIAYFSFEFGLHECLPVYAGGLGILAGDHLKEASDLGMPVVGVGFIYNQGYFVQRITEDGWQETSTYYLDYDEVPIIPLTDAQGQPVLISVELPGRTVHARLWQVQVGRVALYLLDTNLEQNQENDRQLTARLYSSDPEVRISQEILLGIGGVRALRRLGLQPKVWHMNEGHSAFLVLERARELVQSGLTFEQAAAQVRKGNVFTTHTPVPAGVDQFPLWLVDKYLSALWPQLGLTREELIALGHQTTPWGEAFCMPVLALRLSDHANAVSELHGEVSRRMWNFLWPERRPEDVPIIHITNGVHTPSWLARRLRLLYERYLGPDWLEHLDEPELWDRVASIPDHELWAVRQHLKRKLALYVNERARQLWMRGNVHPSQVLASGVFLEPYSLTIGFARRFATYKRATLILRDYERLLRLITNPDMPVQIVFAGKAHPADEPGKLLIQQVYRAVKDPRAAGRLVFLEDYDMNLARLLVQGVDVWLNNPRRPNEASGTSGMKAALNGVLNFSVLDGWWREAYNGANGWAIGEDADPVDPAHQDELDALSLYDTLEKEIIPLYYQNRSADNIPSGWIARIKESIRTLAPQFSTRRMLKEYLSEMYLPCLEAEEAVTSASGVTASVTSSEAS
ncbi:alpha-glucan family phosphorylase [uncultured Thermanaerothrix sp.]|uniref:alpha-glucan family phosphorylase n=1 Tax=uncultured Thermanaerothrix sp. TaxID=1195149 RepID=UPI0026127EAD|nr:alpha-glucan family phosphorylase [uncultured Thermanaerothrix sp.]